MPRDVELVVLLGELLIQGTGGDPVRIDRVA